MSKPLPLQTFDFSAFAKRIVKASLRNLARHADDSDLKECIMLAREHGHLTDEETEFYISYWGLAAA